MAWRLSVLTLAALAVAIPTFAITAPSSGPTMFTYAGANGVTFEGLAAPDASGIAPTHASYTTVSNGAEPSILVDDLGRGILIGDQLGVLRSTDGGAHWTRLTIRFIPGNVLGTGIFDGWALAQDAAHTIYASTTDGAVINVARSFDGGATWDLADPSTFVVDAGPIADRPWLATAGAGKVAMIWNVGGEFEGCSFSADGGTTFRTRSSETNLKPIGGLPAVDSSGRLEFTGSGTLYRYNGGPCSNAILSVDLPSPGKQLTIQTATDPTGHTYVSYPTATNGAMQITGFGSQLSLASSKTIQVSPTTLAENTYGTIASRGNGEIAVAWYASSTPGNFNDVTYSGSWDVYVARVTGFWTATPTVHVDKVTSVPNHVGNFCFGGTSCDTGSTPGDRDLLDYFVIAYDTSGNLHLAYGHDGATSNAEVRYTSLPALT